MIQSARFLRLFTYDPFGLPSHTAQPTPYIVIFYRVASHQIVKNFRQACNASFFFPLRSAVNPVTCGYGSERLPVPFRGRSFTIASESAPKTARGAGPILQPCNVAPFVPVTTASKSRSRRAKRGR